MTHPIQSRNYLLQSEISIQNNRLLIQGQDEKSIASIALVSQTLLKMQPKNTTWNKILKFLGFGYWVVLKVKNGDELTYAKVNANSLRKFADMNPGDFKDALKAHPDLDMTEVLKQPEEKQKIPLPPRKPAESPKESLEQEKKAAEQEHAALSKVHEANKAERKILNAQREDLNKKLASINKEPPGEAKDAQMKTLLEALEKNLVERASKLSESEALIEKLEALQQKINDLPKARSPSSSKSIDSAHS